MLVAQEVRKQHFFSRTVIMLIACIIGITAFSIGPYSLPKATPLLLNSGTVLAEEAEVTIILWIENGDIQPEIWSLRPMPDWVWTSKRLYSQSGKVSLTISGHHRVNRNEESDLYSWYTTRARQFQKTGVQIYFDERVPQAIDISAYLSLTEAVPAQWALEDNTVSIAAYQNLIKSDILAGQDQINIQLLSRGVGTEGQSVLAIPVLLEEF